MDKVMNSIKKTDKIDSGIARVLRSGDLSRLNLSVLSKGIPRKVFDAMGVCAGRSLLT